MTHTHSLSTIDAGPDPELLAVRARLTRIVEGRDFPALSQQIIDTISVLDDDASSLQRLANVVLREYSLTLSVVRTANSVHYRRAGRPIQSATHAMMMLGAKTVRHIAGSLLLFENYHRHSAGLRELMLLSLITANHAREVAAKLGIGDPEEAHLCGMFRNLGEVLVACHFPDDYVRIHALTAEQDVSDASAAHQVLGFRYEVLGEEMSRHWGMPDSVRQGIRARHAAPVSGLSAVTAFSHDLTVAIYRRSSEGAGRPGVAAGESHDIDDLIARHAPRIRLNRDSVRDVVEAALNETRELFRSAGLSVDALRMRELSHAATNALGVPAIPTGDWGVVAPEGIAASSNALKDLRERLHQELGSKVDPASGSDVGEVLLLALESALRGGPFDRVVACVLNADRTRLCARSGLGAGVEELLPHFNFAMVPSGGPVVAALLQRQELYLPGARDLNTSEARWAQSIGVKQFGIFPILVAGKIVGCLYADRKPGEALPDRGALQYVKEIIEQVIRAIEARRKVTVAGAPVVPGEWQAALEASLKGRGAFNAESKGALVMQLLQGKSATGLAASTGIAPELLEQWRKEFLAGAIARLAGS